MLTFSGWTGFGRSCFDRNLVKLPLAISQPWLNLYRGQMIKRDCPGSRRNWRVREALVVLAIIVAGFAGYALGHTGGYAAGYAAGVADANPDYNKIQESMKSTEVNYFGYLQNVLSKLALDSENRSAKSPSAGFGLSIPRSRLRMIRQVCSARIRLFAVRRLERRFRRRLRILATRILQASIR
jgi:hypothetical protein